MMDNPENKVLKFLEKNHKDNLGDGSFYGFIEHWSFNKDLLNIHFRKLSSILMAITRDDKRAVSFEEDFNRERRKPFGIGSKNKSSDEIIQILSYFLSERYETPNDPIQAMWQITGLHHCYDYFEREKFKYLPLDTQLWLDAVMAQLSFAIGEITSKGSSLGHKEDYDLNRTGKIQETKRTRREKVVEPEVIAFLKNYLNQVDPKKHFEAFHCGEISDGITKEKKPKESRGFGKDVVIEITREYFKEKGIERPWKKYGKAKK
jgi:hypothetical protein